MSVGSGFRVLTLSDKRFPKRSLPKQGQRKSSHLVGLAAEGGRLVLLADFGTSSPKSSRIAKVKESS